MKSLKNFAGLHLLNRTVENIGGTKSICGFCGVSLNHQFSFCEFYDAMTRIRSVTATVKVFPQGDLTAKVLSLKMFSTIQYMHSPTFTTTVLKSVQSLSLLS